jgi:hypothetical protein
LDGVGTVGAASGWFTWFPNPTSTNGHIVQFYSSTAGLTGVAAGTTTLTLQFAGVPSHYPNSPVSVFSVIDGSTQAAGLFSSAVFVIRTPALSAGAHQLQGLSTNYLSAT